MSPAAKALIGLVAAVVAAWVLHEPFGLGAGCAAGTAATAPLLPPEPAAPPSPTPQAATTAPTAPTPAPVAISCQTEMDARLKGQTINFATGGAAIAPGSMPLLETVASVLRTCADAAVEVSGHTDSTGTDAINQPLSERRAQAVVAALTERGVPAERLAAKGYGSSQPLDPSGGEAANAKNRRIEFHVAAAAVPAR